MAKKDSGGYPIPNVIDPEETMSVTLCVPKNRDHLATFFGALYELTIWTSWQRDAEHSAVQVADVWSRYWLSWDRTLRDTECEDDMGKCCVDSIVERRIDPVTGRPQVRYDGGAWQQDPNDPALSVTRPQPPVTSGAVDTSCTAALNAYNGMLSLIADSSSNIATASTAYELATLVAAALLNVFLLVVTGGVASPLVLTITGILWGVGTAAFELGQAGFDAYWADADTLRELKCALVDNIGSDGSFTDAQYEAFRTQFKFNSPSSPARDFVLTSLGIGGAAGLSVMATLGDAEGGDCSECEDMEFFIYAGLYDGSATLREPTTPPNGYEFNFIEDPTRLGVYVLYVYRGAPEPTQCFTFTYLAVPPLIETVGWFDSGGGANYGVPSVGAEVYGLFFEDVRTGLSVAVNVENC